MHLFKKKQQNIDDQQLSNETLSSNEDNLKKQNYKLKKVIKILTKVILLILLTFSLIRFPYVGSFFDATFFSILFGYTKYVAYFLIYFYLLFDWYLKKKNFKLNWKYVGMGILIWLIVSIIISAVGIQIDYSPFRNQFQSVQQYLNGSDDSFFGYWLKNDWGSVATSDFKVNNWFFLNPRSYGGIISFIIVILFESIAPIILAIIMSLALITIGGLYINKYLKSHGKQVGNKQENNSLKVNVAKKNNDISEYISLVDSKKFKLPIGSIDNLNETKMDFEHDLELYAKEFTTKLDNFFKDFKIDIELQNTEIMYRSVTNTYKLKSKENLNLLKANLENLQLEFTNLEINYYFENYIFVISQKLDLKSIISLKEILLAIGEQNYYSFALGKLSDRKALYFKTLNQPNTIIFGSKGSGHSMLMSNMILSISALNNENLLNINIIDSSGKTLKNLQNLPQTKSFAIDNASSETILDNIVELIKERKDLIKENKVKNVFEYNLKFTDKKEITPNLLVIHGLEELLLWNKDNTIKKLEFILNNSLQTGIIVLISSSVINKDTTSLNKLFNNLVVLKTETTEDSQKLLDSDKAKYLWGSGDAILKTNNEMYHFQTFFVNKEETNNIVDIINANRNN